MGTHLTIISYPERLNVLFEDIALKSSQGSRGGRSFFARFQKERRGELRMALAAHASNLDDGDQDISCVDLVGHGTRSNGFKLGEESIIKQGRLSDEFTEVLNEMIPADTPVRLLGCLTGSGWVGLGMLQAVSIALNGREVLGTTAILQAHHFDPGGLKQGFTQLVSSREMTPKSTHLWQPTPEDAQASADWLNRLPKGYAPIGRGHPLAKPEEKNQHSGVTVTYACEDRLVAIQDSPDRPPLLFQWNDKASPMPQLPSRMRLIG